jgi:hypothetical protein
VPLPFSRDSVLTEETHPATCAMRREMLWIESRIQNLKLDTYKKHSEDSGPDFDHSECDRPERQ